MHRIVPASHHESTETHSPMMMGALDPHEAPISAHMGARILPAVDRISEVTLDCWSD